MADQRGQYTSEDFKGGKLPDTFREDYNIIDPTLPASLAFSAEMNRIINRLFKDNTQQYRFLLSGDNNANAYFLPDQFIQPPTFVVTQAMLPLFASEDELAGLLAHEFTHKQLTDKYGVHSNSKPEEIATDARW